MAEHFIIFDGVWVAIDPELWNVNKVLDGEAHVEYFMEIMDLFISNDNGLR